jgi:hypothetical protein
LRTEPLDERLLVPVDPVGGREAEIEATARERLKRDASATDLRSSLILVLDVLARVRPSGSAAQNQEGRLWHALFRAKGAIPSSYGELHRELGEVLAVRSPQSEDYEEGKLRAELQSLVDEARADDEWVSGNDLLVRVGAIVLDRLSGFSTTARSPQDEDHEAGTT